MHDAAGPALSLRHLLILLTAIGLLPLALLGTWSIHGAGRYVQQEQERLLVGYARALSSAVDAELDATVAALSGIAKSPALAAGDLRAFHETARRMARADWLGVVLSDADGRPLLRTMAPYGAAPARIADPASLQQAMAERRPVAGHVARGQGGRPAVPVRIPVIGPDGQPWVLSAVVQPDRFLDVIARQNVPPGSLIGVLDGAATLVARSRDQDGTVVGLPSTSLRDLMRRHGPESVGKTRTLEGDDVVSAYTTSPRYGWVVAVGAPGAGFGVGFLQRFAVYAVGTLLLLGACIGIASWLSQRIVRSIQALQLGAAALGSGAPVAPAPARIKEIRLMGQALEAAARQRDAHEEERSRLLASLENALAQARDAGVAKDAFLAMLGHELRNPLSPILTSLDLMDLRNEAGNVRERAVMRRQVTHLRRLVDDLLDVSRIASGKLAIDMRPLNLAETVRHAVAAAGGAVTLDAPPALWVDGDETRLAQVLGNLLSNAARFGSSATRVTLDTHAGRARIVVADNGAGMAPDLIAHVFEPFYQAPQPLARRTGGLGLGLAIVHEIVALHGGSVAAFSDGPGAGSRFEVTLPAGVAPAADAAAGNHGQGSARRILLVDDNEDAAAASAALLRHLGHTVRVAHSAAQARALASAEVPDVAILDIGLPDMDGYALAAALRADGGAAAANMRLVALTGYGQQSDVARALAAGFDDHLTKPAGIDALQRALAHDGADTGRAAKPA